MDGQEFEHLPVRELGLFLLISVKIFERDSNASFEGTLPVLSDRGREAILSPWGFAYA